MINYFQVGLYFRIMKIKDLDRNEIYGLEEIKKDAVKFNMLKKWLEENDNWDSNNSLGLSDTLDLFYSKAFKGWYHDGDYIPTKCALTLFDIDIRDYQVDCTDLSKEQIDNLKYIVLEKGFDVNEGIYKKVNKELGYFYFKVDKSSEFYIGENDSSKTSITYGKFIELFGEETLEVSLNRKKKELLENIDNQIKQLKESRSGFEKEKQGYKESDNKCNYELDFDFIEQLAMRIQNEPKYEPYNWQKPMDIEKLSNAMLRHAIEVKKGNFDDNGELGHLLAIAANAMFIYHQKKNNDRRI